MSQSLLLKPIKSVHHRPAKAWESLPPLPDLCKNCFALGSLILSCPTEGKTHTRAHTLSSIAHPTFPSCLCNVLIFLVQCNFYPCPALPFGQLPGDQDPLSFPSLLGFPSTSVRFRFVLGPKFSRLLKKVSFPGYTLPSERFMRPGNSDTGRAECRIRPAIPALESMYGLPAARCPEP